MQLFGSFTSPYVRHARLVVLQTQAQCEFTKIDALGPANDSPTMKVPYLKDGNIELTDSSSIIRYLREKAGQRFLASVEDFDLYCIINTILDSCINTFLLERNGVNITDNSYLQRQTKRVNTGLAHLNSLDKDVLKRDQDVFYRLMCFAAWGQYRNLLSIEGLSTLTALLEELSHDTVFMSTQPPQ